MQQIKVSSKGQIVIPKQVREALNLTEGSRLTLEIRGQDIVLSREAPWKKLQGAAAGDLMESFAAFKKQEREREDARP
ncbi:MAG: AbrB/MazE/SpoVT family DNA-binding domain-containing protein [Silvibacterium sp.]|nr:AbrB/MazE/SpoVT family DNA-binding domain-containing protein [Silvibacterium sp.]